MQIPKQLRRLWLNKRGIATIGICTAIGVVLMAQFSGMSLFLERKAANAHRSMQSTRNTALFEMISTRVLSELKVHYQDSTNAAKVIAPLARPSLDVLLRPTSRMYNVTIPRIFGKGQFQLDLPTSAGGPSPMFIASESDVVAYISPSIGGGLYLLTIQAILCRRLMSGRVRFPPESVAAPTPGLNVAWNPACPASEQLFITHTMYVNTNSPIFTR